MSHVDEGLIHAYIDGAFQPGNEQGEEIEAHMAVCVDCRVRLENARELKERAQVVMHRLAPNEIVAPPFEEVLARRNRAGAAAPAPAAEQQGPRPLNRRRSDAFPIPFAWAATVILAVGAGWMGRELVMNQRMEADQAAAVVDSEAPAAAAPLAPTSTTMDAAAEAGADVASGAASADRARQEPEQAEMPAREAVTGFAPPTVSQKAVDTPVTLRAEQGAVAAAPPVLTGIEARAVPREVERRRLANIVGRVTTVDEAVSPTSPLVLAYLRATVDSSWTADPVAAFGLIGYEPIARIDDMQPVISERAVADSVELLRAVYVLDGDTVEVVQQLKQRPLSLDEIVVTGVVRGDSGGVRADTTGARRPQEIAAAQLQPARADADARRDTSALGERAALALDTADAFARRSVVTASHDGRPVLLISRMPAESLRSIAARLR